MKKVTYPPIITYDHVDAHLDTNTPEKKSINEGRCLSDDDCKAPAFGPSMNMKHDVIEEEPIENAMAFYTDNSDVVEPYITLSHIGQDSPNEKVIKYLSTNDLQHGVALPDLTTCLNKVRERPFNFKVLGGGGGGYGFLGV